MESRELQRAVTPTAQLTSMALGQQQRGDGDVRHLCVCVRAGHSCFSEHLLRVGPFAASVAWDRYSVLSQARVDRLHSCDVIGVSCYRPAREMSLLVVLAVPVARTIYDYSGPVSE